MAMEIITSRRLSSRAAPHPGEFLPLPEAGGFQNIGGFHGRGIVLRFEWTGVQKDIPQCVMQYCESDILYHVFFSATSKNDVWIVDRNTYWHSRINPVTISRLRLVEAIGRNAPIPDTDDDSLIELSNPSTEDLAMLNILIGDGLEIHVVGVPPDLSRAYLFRDRTLPTKTLFRRFLSLLRPSRFSTL